MNGPSKCLVLTLMLSFQATFLASTFGEDLANPTKTRVSAKAPLQRDAAFDGLVNLKLVGDALVARDASLLADLAFQLRQAEKTLRRRHQSGVASELLMEKAVRTAVESRDQATLERLTKAAQQLPDEQLAASIKSAQKLYGASRAAESDIMIDVDRFDAETYLRLVRLNEAIREAALAGDVEQLKSLEAMIRSGNLPPEMPPVFLARIERALADLPQDGLGKLVATSRAICTKCSATGRYFSGFRVVRCDRCNGSGFTRDDDGGGTAGWDTETSSSQSGSGGNIERDNQVKTRFSYTLWNGCGNTTVEFRLPGNFQGRLAPGEKCTYNFNGSAKDAVMYVYNTNKEYKLRSGSHKFWWMKKENRVGFDRNY